MPTKQIPARQPVGDLFHGALLRINDTFLLATTAEQTPTVTLVKQGDFTIRYGIAYLGKPHLALVPGLLALDYGEILNGEDAFHFILKKSNLYPRADVIGYRNDGADEMIALKWLDLALPVRVLVYEDSESTTPIAHVESIIAPAGYELPERLSEYTTQFETIAAWRQGQLDS